MDKIEAMSEGGRKLALIKEKLVERVEPGVTTGEIDAFADELIRAAGGSPSFKMVRGYKHATCVNINEVVVHGIPGREKIKKGDLVGIDVGLYYKGWHTDTATTVMAGETQNKGGVKFLALGKSALKKAIAVAKPGNRIWDISAVIQQEVERAGYGVVRALTGHGVGKKLHEEPAIPCFALGEREKSAKIHPGMTLAIEVMYNLGTGEVVYKNDDGWTIITADGKISGLFEETVAVTASGPRVLTT